MRQLRRRPYNRDDESPFALTATHLIKIGWNAAEKKGERKSPQRLRGFLLCRNSWGEDGKPEVEIDLMLRLGYSQERVAQGIAKAYHADSSCLPSSISVAIRNDAVRLPSGDWDFPGVFGEQLTCFNKEGLFCFGDGFRAHRKQKDGSRSEIECVPKGAAQDDETVCEFSARGDCSLSARFICSVVAHCAELESVRNYPWQCLLPLHDDGNSTYRLDTGSDSGASAIRDALSQAAGALNGRITGLTGTLTLNFEGRIKPGGGGVRVPQIRLEFDKAQIEWMRRELKGLRLDAPASMSRIALPSVEDVAPEIYEAIGRPESEQDGGDIPTKSKAMNEEADKEAVPSTATNADPEKIAAALAILCEREAANVGAKFSDVCKTMCDPIRHGGKTFSVPAPEKYLGVPDDWKEDAETALRSTAESWWDQIEPLIAAGDAEKGGEK